jgi:hypothetical protein
VNPDIERFFTGVYLNQTFYFSIDKTAHSVRGFPLPSEVLIVADAGDGHLSWVSTGVSEVTTTVYHCVVLRSTIALDF